MQWRPALNRMDIFGLLAATMTTFVFFGAASNAAGVYNRAGALSTGAILLGCAGWAVATFGPIALAVLLWRGAKRFNRGWLLHLLMLPLAIGAVNLGSSMMLWVTSTPDFDDTLGGPVLQAGLLFVLAVFGYYLAVLYTVLHRRVAVTSVR